MKDKSCSWFVVVDAVSDEPYAKIPLRNVGSVIGDVHRAPNGNYYLLDAGYHPATGSYDSSRVLVIDPAQGRVVYEIPLPRRTDSMGNITAEGEFLCTSNWFDFEKGAEFTIVDAIDGSTDVFYQRIGPDGTQFPFFAAPEDKRHILPRNGTMLYYVAENGRSAALYQVDPDDKEPRKIFFWDALSLSPSQVEVDEAGGKVYAGIYPALSVSEARQAPLEIQVIDLITGALERRISLPSAEVLFGCEGERSEIFISHMKYSLSKNRLYLNLALFFEHGGRRTSLAYYDLMAAKFTRIFTVDDLGFNTMDELNGKLYLRVMDFDGEDWLLRVDPETGDAKWILGTS